MKVVSVVGARPQFVKAAVVSRALRRSGAAEILLHTGQHYNDEMSSVFFEELEIPEPNHHLGIGSGPHGQQTGRMLEGVERVLAEERPDWVVVHGDTNSTLAGALAACKLHLPVAHVEAGLRSFNRRMPEEINRVLADHVSTLLFAPTTTAVANLAREGIAGDRVRLVGDVMLDAALQFAAWAESRGRGPEAYGLEPGRYVLCTIHRAENTDASQRLAAIVHGLARVARVFPVLLPLHPRTRARMRTAGLLDLTERCLHVVDPVGYLEMVGLERHAGVIATDSGGVQKEAFFYRVPCVTLRDETEWVELVDLGWNRLVQPTSAEAVAAAILAAVGTSGAEAQPYGDGRAAERIADALQAEMEAHDGVCDRGSWWTSSC